jgi:uncharacterized Zn-finger protein
LLLDKGGNALGKGRWPSTNGEVRSMNDPDTPRAFRAGRGLGYARRVMPADSRPVPEPPEVVEVRQARVACDGGEGALGHPRVWLQIDQRGFVDCPYCDRRFRLVAGAAPEH